jgi:hypothetical protein
MNSPKCAGTTYHWTRRDRLVYLATLTPLLVALVGAAYVLALESVYLAVTFVALYAAVNVFQAGCCVGCPYRGKFCPATFGIYPSNLLSARLYKHRPYDPRFFRINANLAEFFLAATLLFPTYWLAVSNWLYLIAFLALVGLHVVTFFPAHCPKCSYNDTCPGGQTTNSLLRRWRDRDGTNSTHTLAD